jgi:putative SOS response-associated peptidase YedK
VHWGLVPHWSKDRSVAYKLINARAESIATKPSFCDAFERRRCIVPADGFYEWKKTGTGKQPYLILLKGGALFGFAALLGDRRTSAASGCGRQRSSRRSRTSFARPLTTR